ncbi:MAG TPA: hypothetical protein VIL12_03095 [Acidimicrobiia bacterium]
MEHEKDPETLQRFTALLREDQLADLRVPVVRVGVATYSREGRSGSVAAQRSATSRVL